MLTKAISKKDCGALIGVAVFFVLFGWYCPVYWITGVPCPGCFMSRALISLLSGKFSQAMNYNPCAFLLIPVFLVVLGAYIVTKKLWNRVSTIAVYIFSGLLIITWLYRMFTQFPADPTFAYNHSSLFGVLFFG